MRIFTAVFLFISTVVTSAMAMETVNVDARVRSEDKPYRIVISARNDGEYGHAWITWNEESGQLQMSTNRSLGFYPKLDSEGPADPKKEYKVIFGLTGEMKNDSDEQADYQIIIDLNSDQYQRAKLVYDKWEQGHRYFLGIQDCTTFVGEVVAAAGLNVPSRMFSPYPVDYVKSIAQLQLDKVAADEREAAEKAQRDAAEQAQRVAAEQAQREAEARAYLERVEAERVQAENEVRRRAEEQARLQEEERRRQQLERERAQAELEAARRAEEQRRADDERRRQEEARRQEQERAQRAEDDRRRQEVERRRQEEERQRQNQSSGGGGGGSWPTIGGPRLP